MELFSIRIQRTFQLVSTAKEGYTKALEILKNNDVTFNRYDELKTIQSKSIAAITVDYLRGECAQEILCNIPLK